MVSILITATQISLKEQKTNKWEEHKKEEEI